MWCGAVVQEGLQPIISFEQYTKSTVSRWAQRSEEEPEQAWQPSCAQGREEEPEQALECRARGMEQFAFEPRNAEEASHDWWAEGRVQFGEHAAAQQTWQFSWAKGSEEQAWQANWGHESERFAFEPVNEQEAFHDWWGREESSLESMLPVDARRASIFNCREWWFYRTKLGVTLKTGRCQGGCLISHVVLLS